jgi:hypothetical protein
MLRKLNFAIAMMAVLVAGGLAAGQSRQNGAAPASLSDHRIKPGTDPCGPWFVGTVFVPCNTKVGTLNWNQSKRQYDISFDETLTQQAYAQYVEKYRQAQNPKGRVSPPPDYGRFLDALRDLFSGLSRQVLPENPKENSGEAARKFPGQIELGLDVHDGKLGGTLTWRWPA